MGRQEMEREEASGLPAVSPPRNLRRHDSLDMESAHVGGHHGHGPKVITWAVTLQLAFQSLGVVYGDIGTSPLYVYASTFTDEIKHRDDILGVLSLIFYTFTLLPIIKYVFIVLLANDNGNGGTFALYSLLCRHVKIGLLPSNQVEDSEVSTYNLQLPSHRAHWSYRLKSALETTSSYKFLLLFITMFSTALVIGDGILTPSISVLDLCCRWHPDTICSLTMQKMALSRIFSPHVILTIQRSLSSSPPCK